MYFRVYGPAYKFQVLTADIAEDSSELISNIRKHSLLTAQMSIFPPL